MKIIQHVFCTLVLIFAVHVAAQNKSVAFDLNENYPQYKEQSLHQKRIKHHQLQPLIAELKNLKSITVRKVGSSIQGRDLSLISLGNGPVSIFLWSQMHGDETTATQAIFDMLNYLTADDNKTIVDAILNKVTLHFLPMLNPDGAELFTRRNTLGVDINRDALRLQSPEGQTLKRVRDSLNADFGFNLHDQSTYYNAERTNKPATISFLAPAYNYEKEINEVRSNAMKVIGFMNIVLQELAPGQVAKYNDDFEPRAFGDNIQKWGTSTILIESGGYLNDAEKQEIRRLNYVAILAAIQSIAHDLYIMIPLSSYTEIPENDRKLFNLKITNVTYHINDKPYQLDIGINRSEIDLNGNSDYYYRGTVMDQGDLSTYYGYETFDATGYVLEAPLISKEPLYLRGQNSITDDRMNELHRNGVGYTTETEDPLPRYGRFPMNFVNSSYKSTEFILKPGINATFLLKKEGKIVYIVVNGFLIDVNKPLPKNANGVLIGH